MFGVRKSVWWAAAVCVLALMATQQMTGQTTRRRETSAIRQARIDATTKAEYEHKWEAGGGGGYLRFRSGEYLQKNNEITWQALTTYYRSPAVGFNFEVRGSFGNAKTGNNSFNEAYNPLINQYYFLVGPNYRFLRKEKWSAGVFGEGGAALGNFDGGAKGLNSQDLGLWQSATRPAFSAGVNLDYNIYPNLYFRLSPTYVGTVFQLSPLDTRPQPHGGLQNNAGVELWDLLQVWEAVEVQLLAVSY